MPQVGAEYGSLFNTVSARFGDFPGEGPIVSTNGFTDVGMPNGQGLIGDVIEISLIISLRSDSEICLAEFKRSSGMELHRLIVSPNPLPNRASGAARFFAVLCTPRFGRYVNLGIFNPKNSILRLILGF